jgi:MFS family permease
MLNAKFICYLIAYVLVTLASSMLSVAVGWHIYQATGNPFDLALVGLMQMLPIAGLFIFAGWVVDNFRRDRILVACTVLQGVAYIGLAFSLGGDSINKLAAFSLLFLNGVARVFFGPAMQSTLPRIVEREELTRAVAISSTAWTTAGTGGPFLAGLLIAWIDTGVYWALGLVVFVAACFFLALPRMTVTRSMGRGVAQLLDGIRYVVTNPFVLPGISLDLFIVLLGSVVALLPVYAIDILNVGPEALGLLRAMPALGAVIAGVLIARVPTLRHSGKQLFVALALFALSILVFAVSEIFWLSLVALLVYGASDMVSVNIRTTLIQLATPDELRGRVSAVNSLFISASNDLGDFRAGTAATIMGPVTTVLVGGVMALGVTAGGYLLFPKLRQLDRISEAQYDAIPRTGPRNAA